MGWAGAGGGTPATGVVGFFEVSDLGVGIGRRHFLTSFKVPILGGLSNPP